MKAALYTNGSTMSYDLNEQIGKLIKTKEKMIASWQHYEYQIKAGRVNAPDDKK